MRAGNPDRCISWSLLSDAGDDVSSLLHLYRRNRFIKLTLSCQIIMIIFNVGPVLTDIGPNCSWQCGNLITFLYSVFKSILRSPRHPQPLPVVSELQNLRIQCRWHGLKSLIFEQKANSYNFMISANGIHEVDSISLYLFFECGIKLRH